MKKETTESAFNWEYAPAPEAKDHIKLKSQYDLFINGKFVKPNSKKYFATHNPSTEEKLAEVAQANAKDVDTAVAAAKQPTTRHGKKCRQKNVQNIFSELRV